MQQDNLSFRTLKTSFLVTLAVSVALFCAALPGWAWGFLIGATLSLFSLCSLGIAVPMLFRPGGSRHVRFLLALTLYMKLPIYAAGLYIGTRMPGVQPVALVFGIGLVPAVISLKTIGAVIRESVQVPQAERNTVAEVVEEAEKLLHAERTPASAPRPAHAEPIYEGG